MDDLNSHYINAFNILFNDCLNCTANEQVLVIFDDTTINFIPSLIKAAVLLDINLSLNYLPIQLQLALIQRSEEKDSKLNSELPTGTALSINESESIVTLINGYLKTGRLRHFILDENRSSDSKLAHIPGFGEEILSILEETDFNLIQSDAGEVAWALGQASSAKLITSSISGDKFELELGLGGWNEEPIISTGVILPNSWGNIPPGETFCCPNHKTVNGEICINGSIPGIPMVGNEEVVLSFKDGIMDPNVRSFSRKIKHFFELEEKLAIERGDRNWNKFAELGIGLNRAVKVLTGINVFDEKKYGSVHIAIGDNEIFGFGTQSYIHADMATLQPSLELDGRELINDGAINIAKIAEWRSGITVSKYDYTSKTRIKLNRLQMAKQQGFFYRKLNKKGRIGLVPIAKGEAALLYSCLTDNLDEIEDKYYIDIKENADEDYLQGSNYTIEGLLDTLNHYKIIELMG